MEQDSFNMMLSTAEQAWWRRRAASQDSSSSSSAVRCLDWAQCWWKITHRSKIITPGRKLKPSAGGGVSFSPQQLSDVFTDISLLYTNKCFLFKSCSFNSDLAVFYTQSDVDNLYLQPYFAWVGLSKTGDKWLWPDGKVLESNFNPWPQWFQPNLLDGCAYANYNDKR